MIISKIKSFARVADLGAEKIKLATDLISHIELAEVDPPEVSLEKRYMNARRNMERFSILQTWWALAITEMLPQPGGFGMYPFPFDPNHPPDHTINVTTNLRSPFWMNIGTPDASHACPRSFPVHVNLHLLNIIYYNCLSSEFFRDLTKFVPSPRKPTDAQGHSVAITGNDLVVLDTFTLEGFNIFTGWLLKSEEDQLNLFSHDPVSGYARGTLFGMMTGLIRALSIEPHAFPVIVKLPSGEFIFLFVRNKYNEGDLLTDEQQASITKKDPMMSYIKAFNQNGLKVLSYLSIKTCKRSDGTFYYVPTDMYSLDITGLEALKYAYVISMFTIALKFLGGITVPRMNRIEPPIFDAQLTEAVRYSLNPNYVSMYDRKNNLYMKDPTKNHFNGYTFQSSEYWGTTKFLGNDSMPTTVPYAGPVDSHPDFLGLGDISSKNPKDNEISFIEISQWDITEGMKTENQNKAMNMRGTCGLVNFDDYMGVEKSAPVSPDQDSGISVGDGTVGKGFLAYSDTKYDLPAGNTLFKSLRCVAAKAVIPAQKSTAASGKFFGIKEKRLKL